jgi:hypothetical protein
MKRLIRVELHFCEFALTSFKGCQGRIKYRIRAEKVKNMKMNILVCVFFKALIWQVPGYIICVCYVVLARVV